MEIDLNEKEKNCEEEIEEETGRLHGISVIYFYYNVYQVVEPEYREGSK